MTRILIADDHDVVRSGLRAILEEEAGWEIVAEAADGLEASAEPKRPFLWSYAFAPENLCRDAPGLRRCSVSGKNHRNRDTMMTKTQSEFFYIDTLPTPREVAASR
jgi:hypothetical protein